MLSPLKVRLLRHLFITGLFSSLFACNTVHALDEALQKSGTSKSDNISNKGIADWVITHANSRNTIMENVILTDRLGSNQTMQAGSLILPQGWSAQYSTNSGTSFSTIEPVSGVNALILSNPYVVPTDLGQGRTLTLPLTRSVSFSGGGDGYNPAITSDGKVLGVNHHAKPANIWCYDTKLDAICKGYPTSSGIGTVGHPYTRAIGKRIYFPGADTPGGGPSPGYIYCWDPTSRSKCGKTPHLPLFDQLRDIDTKLYTLLSDGSIDCYDTQNELKRCTGYPIKTGTPAINYGYATNANGTGADLIAVGKRLYALSSNSKLNCLDTTTNRICSGWSATPKSLRGVFNLFARTNADGSPIGVCAGSAGSKSTNTQCFDLDGQNPTIVNMGSIAPLWQMFSDDVSLGSKVWFTNYYSGLKCWDWALNNGQGAACQGAGYAGGQTSQAGAPYGVGTDDACVYSYGNSGILMSWDPDTGKSPCYRSAGDISVDMDAYFCKDTAGTNATWDKVKFYDTDLTPDKEFASARVSLINAITGTIVKGPIEMIGSNGELDISDIPASVRQLKMRSISIPKGRVAWADGIDPKVALTFKSTQPARFCYSSNFACTSTSGGGGSVITRNLTRASQAIINSVQSNITAGLMASAVVSGCNSAPVIRSPAMVNFPSLGQDPVIDILSTDDTDKETLLGNGLTYGITGGDDMARFKINPVGVLEFITPPNAANPTDLNADSEYQVEVTVADRAGLRAKRLFMVTVISDADGDGVPDVSDLDIDGDGISNSTEGNADSDGDGVPDKQDSDSDNDGIPDLVEAQTKTNYQSPEGIDSNGDGIDNAYGKGLIPNDSDKDGQTDPYDRDDDNDNVPTASEAPDPNGDGEVDDARDTDKDGVPDYLDTDDDNDGKLTATEQTSANNLSTSDKDGDGIPDYLDALDLSILKLKVRGLLQGGYDGTTGWMNDELRLRDLLPAQQPYSDPASSFGYTGTETLPSALLWLTGADAPVDWVLVELRDATNPLQRVHAIATLLQRDGDVADTKENGTTLQIPNMADGHYHVALRHRNHLGVMTLNPVYLSGQPTSVDFTLPETPVYGSYPRTEQAGKALMWAGDTNNSNSIIGIGPGNDTNFMQEQVLGDTENTLINTNFAVRGYYTSDLNMDGVIISSGPGNDRNLVVSNILLHPLNTTTAGNYTVQGGMPQ